MSSPERVRVAVDGRDLTLSNLDKVLYPATGFTKAQVIDYYTRVAPVLLPHVRDRPATLVRLPDGIGGTRFFAKNVPAGTPDWVARMTLPSPGSSRKSETVTYPLIQDLPTLVWAANLAGIELHVPMWRLGSEGRPQEPDLIVLDLDPGPPATVVECARLALVLAERLRSDGLEPVAKTSGSKGMQLYAPVGGAGSADTSRYAKALAEREAAAQPDRVVSVMRKEVRPGRVLIDWSQNNGAKTTVAAYSLRGRDLPTVSTPLTWDEVAGCADDGDPETLRFTSDAVLARVDELGDLFAPADPAAGTGPALPGVPSGTGAGPD